jgi:uncharacterized protein (TIGR02145 family)
MIKKNVFIQFWLLLSLCTAAVSFSSCEKEEEKNGTSIENTQGVLINGVRWATGNVDQPGTIASSPEDPGMFYQWNRKKAWSATGDVTSWNKDSVIGDFWEKANDPSPVGYRVPTKEEIQSLLDEDKVSNEWTTVNNVNGRKFTDKATGASIFLPAVGFRYRNTGKLGYDGMSGYYWSSTADEDFESNAVDLSFYSFGSFGADWYYDDRLAGFSVRPVVE